MKRFFREIAFDIKEPGIHMWVIPIAAIVFLVIAFLTQQYSDATGHSNQLTLPLLEILIPSLGGYGALMLMQGLLDTEGGELSFTYQRTYLYWGLIRQLRFFSLFVLFIAAVCGALAVMIHTDFIAIFLLTSVQSFAVMAVSFLGVTAGKKVSVGFIVLVAFVGIQITLGREYQIFNWIYAINGDAPSYEQLGGIAFRAIPIGIFGWGIGQVWLRP